MRLSMASRPMSRTRKEEPLFKIEAIIRPEKFEAVKVALAREGFAGLNAVNRRDLRSGRADVAEQHRRLRDLLMRPDAQAFAHALAENHFSQSRLSSSYLHK